MCIFKRLWEEKCQSREAVTGQAAHCTYICAKDVQKLCAAVQNTYSLL
jgi:hypothetical protein